MPESKIRTAQQKGDKSITITLPVKDTGIKPGDGVIFETVSEGIVILTKIKKEEIYKEISTVDKIFHMFGLHNIVHYRLKSEDEIKELSNV